MATAALAAPDAGQGGMERQLHFVLEIDSGPREQGQQGFEVWRHFIEQGRLYKRGHE